MSEIGKAVFLSYAREDADSARRIAEALRAFGLEVWFDQNELRGGDQWDAKIKKQIRECTLFMPVISTRTQERAEGYFRREWKLAVERTHDMAAGIAFIVPVVIDGTRENDAAVPEEFLRYQWAHLPGALPSPQFVEQVKRLLEAPRKAARSVVAGVADPGPASARPATSRGISVWAWGALAVVVIGLTATFIATRKPAAPARAAANPEPQTQNSRPLDLASAKSIAVLPFTNMSDDKDSGYFADGVHEDILTNLSNIGQLRVVSRTSVMDYRATTKKIRQIGEELRVAFLLEGSVRRAGNKLRLTAQLINARTDEHLWAKTYDRDLTDVFAVQSELAREIARSLQTALTPQERARLERSPTASLEAYDLLLKAREIPQRGLGARRPDRVPLLERAVGLDPGLVEAWVALSDTYSADYFTHRDRSPAKLAKAREAIGQATRLAPDDPAVLVAEGVYYLNCFRDYARARERFESVQRRWPNLAHVYGQLGNVASREGRWADAVLNYRRSGELEPRSYDVLGNLYDVLEYVRRHQEAISVARQMAALRPDDLGAGFRVADTGFCATGDPKIVEDWLASVPANRRSEQEFETAQAVWAFLRGDATENVRWRRETGATGRGFHYALFLATGLEQARDTLAEALKAADDLIASQPESRMGWGDRSMLLAILGETDAALAAANRAVELMPETLDAKFGAVQATWRAQVLALVGRKDEAVQELARLLRKPCLLNVHEMRHELAWRPLQGYPPFEALLADPKNNEPLF